MSSSCYLLTIGIVSVVSSIVDSDCPSTLQADACSGGGRDCHRCRCPAIRCLSASCLSCRPSSIATAHPPCKQMLAAVVVVLVAVVILSSVKPSIVDSCCPSTPQVDACSSGGRACRVVVVLLSAVHQRLVICRVVSSVVASNCPSTLQGDACSGGGRACRHRHRAKRRPCHL